MKCNTKKLACILFVSVNIFLSGFMYDRAFATKDENITKTNMETTFSNATYNEKMTNTNLMNSINELNNTIQTLDASYFQVDPAFAKNMLHNDLEQVKHAILNGEDVGAFNGLIDMAKKIQAFVKSSGQDKIIPIIHQIIESMNKPPPPEPQGYNLTRYYDVHPDLPIQSVYLMRTIPVSQVDFTIQNLDNSYFVNHVLAKNTLHNDLEKVKLAILDGEQYATYSILVNMTKKIQGPNLVTSSGKDKILPMIETIESIKIETTPISAAPSTPLEHYVYKPNPEELWKISPWIIIGLLVIAVAGWVMFAIYRTRSSHP